MNRKELRDKILQLVELFGEDNLIDAPFKEGDVIPPSGKVIGGRELKMMTVLKELRDDYVAKYNASDIEFGASTNL